MGPNPDTSCVMLTHASLPGTLYCHGPDEGNRRSTTVYSPPTDRIALLDSRSDLKRM
jgi:hypothetical protein